MMQVKCVPPWQMSLNRRWETSVSQWRRKTAPERNETSRRIPENHWQELTTNKLCDGPQKHVILGAEENFSLGGYTGSAAVFGAIVWRCNPPPPRPKGGNRHDIGGKISTGGGKMQGFGWVIAMGECRKAWKFCECFVSLCRKVAMRQPWGIAMEDDGNMVVSDLSNHCLWRIQPDGVASLLAGTGSPGLANGPCRAAQFWEPRGVAVGADGSVFVADSGNNCIRRIGPDGQVRSRTISTLCPEPPQPSAALPDP